MRKELEAIPENAKIAIVGSGALGSYFGACLAHAGQDVHFLVRSDYEALRESGLSVAFEDDPSRDFTLNEVQVYRSTEEIGPADIVLVALKSTHNGALPDLLPPLLKEDTLLVTIQNGLGNAERIADVAASPNVIGVLCQIGVNREKPGLVRSFVPGGGFVQVGEMNGAPRQRTQQLADMLEAAGIRVRVTPSLGEALWRKLMWNVPFNGLTIAAGGVPTDAIVGDQELRQLSADLMEELRRAATDLGFAIEPAYVEKLLHFTDKLGAYLPSSLLDYRARREVEVEAIFGEPLRQGEAAGVPMPHLHTLYALLKAQCRQRLSES